MDFFSEQDQARKSTKILVCLFLLSVLLLIILTNILVAITLWLLDEQLAGNYQAYQQALDTLQYQSTRGLNNYFSWQRFGLITLAVSGVIGCAIFFKWAQLSGGGKRVAEQLGGQRVHPNTDDADEQRLLNVVEEMAIASGMPVPSVYLLTNEMGINAFAAGSTTADAVIGVTQGCIQQFNREQLQGVIAHEFSHILNGDMRLNIRLIAILHGILFIGLIGEILLRSSSRRGYRSSYSSSRRSDNSSIAILGIALLVIGWLGRFFGNWIKSAVSRQREFLADASAVQFTRNPEGIADALKIIGGYLPAAQLENNHASEMSHLFFGQAVSSINSMFSTHPSLEQRIRRIEPSWNGKYILRDVIETTETSTTDNQPTDKKQVFMAATATAAILANDTGLSEALNLEDIEQSIVDLPPHLAAQAHDPFSAMALLFSLLLSNDDLVQKKQLEFIQLNDIKGLSLQTVQLFPEISLLDPSKRLPLIELALPALKCMSEPQYKVFCKTLLLLIRADRQFDLFEWCLYQLVRHFLDAEFGKIRASRPIYKNINQVAKEFELVLSMLCYHGQNDRDDIEKAFGRGANSAGLYTLRLLDSAACSLEKFIDAINKLGNCYPLVKPRLIKALVESAKHDNKILAVEKEMIHAIAAVMDSPVPLLKIGPVIDTSK